ncbi:MAG: polyribonucleotide nucleotidyltransferase, partial [Planctomycetales bacterium]|nr:polyribonucleotide nucleotidyltransferase [Planctomycetales bacterium]
MKVRVEKQIGAEVLSFETGYLAKQAGAAIIVQYGDTVVLNTCTSGPPRPGLDFFPLMCDYRERTSAAGKFPGGFIKREGRPTTKETLTARLMDRPIRPLFPKGFVDDVQCQAIVISSDRQNDGDVLAMNGTAAACHVSSLPFEGPVSSVRIGRVNGEWIPFPTTDQLDESDIDLVVSGNKESVLMIEGFAEEVPEQEMFEAIEQSHKYICEICDLQQELYDKLDVKKDEFVAPEDDGIYDQLKGKYYDEVKAARSIPGKLDRREAVNTVRENAKNEMIPDPDAENAIDEKNFSAAWGALEKSVMRELIVSGNRPDGRDLTTLRNIECFVGLLPRTHGSAVFQRGETQSLVTVTLGTSRDEQRVDGLGEEYSKRFMLDYNFPSYSVGECRPIRGPGRREIGHGALAERSVSPVIPPTDKFPYTIRTISDITESNGSSSMASVCSATLSLMDAGVPLLQPVAGISIGLVKESDDKFTLLTDIMGDEDH